MKRLLRRMVQAVLGLVLLAVLVLAGFRASAQAREKEQRRVPSRSGSFVRTPAGEFRYQERGAPGGLPVIFVGGTMAPSDTFLPLMTELCDERLRCLAIDLPPFGYSERPRDGDYGRESQASRIAAFVSALQLHGAVLVGHSFGAGPVVETAMRYPEQVRTFALMAGALGLGAGPTSPVVHALLSVPASRTAFASATLASPWAIRMSLRKFMERDELITDDLLERFTATTRLEGMSEATGRWAATALFADESASRSGQRSSYQQYQAPVLLVWGDRDVATPPQQAQELAALLPHCSLTMIPGANHFPHVEDQPRVVAALRPFLLAQQADVHTNPE